MSCSSFEADELLVTEESEQDEDDDYYYYGGDDLVYDDEQRKQDPEAFEYSVITQQEAENILESLVQETAMKIEQRKSIARILLAKYNWNVDKVIQRCKNNQQSLLVELRITPKGLPSKCRVSECQVCFQYISEPVAFTMTCGHMFCVACWNAHVAVQLENRVALGIECMKCGVLVGPDHLFEIISRPDLLKKFRFLLLYDQIKTHPLLRCCPEPDCGSIIRAEACKAKRTVCFRCKTSFCFQCGQDYHAPTDCAVIKKWLTKCQDDSETANYIQANTKDCPKCMICIEKNGGCNHMQCYKCKYGFCWVCLGDWQKHSGGYYECSIYKENPALAEQKSGTEARDALKKYLFYYERWHNHGTSLKLEHETRKKTSQKIHEKVNNNVGTWIDWQYLSDAAFLLAKCRYTIMYTYPYAYYMGDERKELFEYQQAQLEQEIENLSWKLEREEQYKRGDFENQMDIAEKRRRTLLKDFLAG